MKRTKKEFYDKAYGEKTSHVASQPGIISFLYKRLKKYEVSREDFAYELLPFGQRFLDIGCGEGNLVLRAKSKFGEVWGVDVSSVRVEKAKKRLNDYLNQEKIHFILGDVDEGLPFDDLFFDAVSCVAVLEHVFYPPALIKEIYRVLKWRGELIVEVPNFAWLPYRLQLLSGKLPVTGMEWAHLHNFTQTSLCYLLKSHGFTITQILCGGIFAYIRRWWPSALASDLVVRTEKHKRSSS